MRSRDTMQAFRHAFSGLWYTLRTQRNMRVHLVITGLLTILGSWLRLPPDQWAVLALTCGLVLISEMINTVVEKLVDLLCPDYHPAAKIVKDVMAGAVVLAAIVAVLVGLLILGPPLWVKLTSWL
ncbi:MAG: diacylglycerol kinase family protein [Anaerolineae bacterium]|jgi:diacylglycerol kinase